ncbi:MAG TPA: MXAN_5808 family serine peptidase [Thermodesulfobacteriota bacterium]|nr:MXAN_5808 family serine peptidase [Thermodesulfobacteriota bacterium]
MRISQLLVITVLVPLFYLSFFYPWIEEQGKELNSSELKVLPLVTHYTKRYYVNQSSINPKKMLVAGLGRLEKTLDEVLVDFPNGENSSLFKVQVMKDTKNFDMGKIDSLDKLEETIEEVFHYVEPRIVSKEYKVSDLEYAVLDEMLKTLDTHSAIITPEVYKEFMIETEGSFGGLGIVIGIRDGRLTVIAPIEGTPAYRAGVKPNDRIVQIEDESTINMSLIEAVGKLRGPKGTVANIHIMRDGFSEAKKYSIPRDTIRIESIESFDLGNGIGYIKIRDFQKNTLDSLKASLKNFEKKNGRMRGIILDLKGNPGGLLEQAERVSDMFLESGVIVSTKVGDSKKPSHAEHQDSEFSGRVVVLVDAGSASASEIVAGALKNNQRAVVIGERTFGKGSVQQIFDLKDGSALKLTIASYLTPGDISIQDTGITPDIGVHPVVISEDLVSFNASFQKDREEKLNGRPLEKSLYLIRYLDMSQPVKPDEEEIPEEALSLEEKKKRIENDFFVNVAKEILLSSNLYSRKEILRQAEAEINQLHDEEEKKIIQGLKKVGVDWSLGNGTLKGTPEISVRVKPGILKTKAGEKLPVNVEVENTGSVTLYRLMAVTEADDPIFDAKEFIFGQLNPGEKRGWRVTFEIPKDSYTREDEITLNFKDAYKTAIPDFTFKVQLEELPRPVFAFSYQIADDGRSESIGNGNGIPEAGETISLIVKVKNIGRGLSEKSILSLQNLSGEKIFLKKGRHEFENLGPGDVEQVVLMFNVKKPNGKIDLTLQVLDETYREVISGNISIPDKNMKADAYKDPPSINVFPIPLSTTSQKVPLKLSVKDKDGIQLVSVFVGDDKVMLIPSNHKELPIHTDIKLKEGINLITILAKDKEGFVSRDAVVVRRDA